MREIKTVTVIGSNGTMGTNVSAIFASFGNAKVYMISRDIEKSKKAVEKACKSVRADSIRNNLFPADYSMIEKCVSESDLVFESTAENLDIKIDVTKKIAASLSNDAIACTGTSGLSITTLAECFPDSLRSHYFGIHFFNPPYNMTLCEVTPTKYTDLSIFDETKKYLKQKLFRTVVEVKDSPAFLANRIGFQFINEAFQYAEKYQDNGGIDYIDSILGQFTGRSMPPLTTADFVGLDVHKAIVDNLYENTADYANDTFVMPEFLQKLVDDNMLGRKTGGGIYKLERYDNGLKRMTVYDISTGVFRDKINYMFPYAEKMKYSLAKGDYEKAIKSLINNNSVEARICVEFMLKYIVYSLNATKEVGYKISSADDVMATGFNWCPPLAMIQVFSVVSDVKKLIYERLDKELLEKIDVNSLLAEVKPSKYDYRLYFKSR